MSVRPILRCYLKDSNTPNPSLLLALQEVKVAGPTCMFASYGIECDWCRGATDDYCSVGERGD
jgi:hypothetical protein